MEGSSPGRANACCSYWPLSTNDSFVFALFLALILPLFGFPFIAMFIMWVSLLIPCWNAYYYRYSLALLKQQPAPEQQRTPWGFEGHPLAIRFDGSYMSESLNAFDIVLSQLRPVYYEPTKGVVRLHPDLRAQTKGTIARWQEIMDGGAVKTVRRGPSAMEGEWANEMLADAEIHKSMDEAFGHFQNDLARSER